jgi:uncharacterized protein (TIGR03084 family)
MDVIVGALAEQQAELSGLLQGLDKGDWERPSRCEGWTVADVVLHLAQTNEMAVASLEGTFAEVMGRLAGGLAPTSSIDEGVDLMVARERGLPPPEIRERWQASADTFLKLLDAADLHQRVTWVAGELSARTLATTRLAETWIHTGDVDVALGKAIEPSPRLQHIARLAWRTLPYAFGRSGRQLTGPVAFELQGAGGEPWTFVPDEPPLTTIRGEALDLCLVAARRADPKDTSLWGEGPDADAVLELVRTYA